MSATSVTKASFKVASTSIAFHGGLSHYGIREARTGTAHVILQRLFSCDERLKNDILKHDFKIYRNEIIEGKELHEIALHLNLGAGETLHLVPVAKGHKGKSASLGKTIAGAAIAIGALAAAPWTGGGSIFATLGTNAFSIGSFGISYGAIAMFGAMTMLGGVAGLIGGSKKNKSDSSTTLSGTVNSVGQGGCIPEIYGRRVRVGSTVVSLAYSAQDWSNKNGDGDDDDNPSGEIDTLSTVADHGEGSFDSLLSGTGSKGKAGSGGSEKSNNLRSKAVVRIIDLIGHGSGIQPVTGTGEEGAKSIYFNGTPLMSAEGNYNFYGVKWAWRSGSKNQSPVQGFPAAENTIQVNTKVAKAAPVIQTVSSETATSARVVISFPALYHTKSSGVIDYGKDVKIKIEAKAPNTDWLTVVSDTFSGKKCTSTYERAYVFSLPEATEDNPPTTWDIRVTRLTDDSTDTGDASDFYFEYLDAITDHQLIYPDCAYCALQFDSSVFGDSIPDRAYDVTGKEIRVPANYDPVNRTYATTGDGTQAGTWDGVTWKVAQACDDPCWCMLDAMVSKSLMALPESKLGTAETDLFIASQYASQKIDDGFGGTECRYSINVAITEAGEAFSVLQQFASVFRGMVYWTGGGISVSIDMPKQPTMIVTNANVVDGNFSYEGTALSGRHNSALASYTNAQNAATPFSDVESYDDSVSVSSIGLQQTTINTFGCTSRGEALRLAHWTVDTELHQTQTVTYQCGIDHASVRVGEVIEVADHWYQGARYGGRVRSNSTEMVVLLDSDTTVNIDLTSGIGYQLKIIAEDGSILSAPIQKVETIVENGNQYTRVTLSTGLSEAPRTNTVWVITDPNSNVLPQWMVVTNSDKGDGVYQITALQYDPAKYARVEQNAPFNEKIFSNVNSLLPAPLTPPSNVTVQDYTVGAGTSTVIRTTVGWKAPVDVKVLGYRVRAVLSGGATLYYDAGTAESYDIDGLDSGDYTFGVQAYGKNGTASAWIDGQSVAVNGNPIAPSAVLGLTAQGGTRKIALSWSASDTRNLLHYELQRAPQRNGDVGDFSTIGLIGATAYTDNDSQILEPETTWYYRIRAIDTYGTDGAWSNIVSALTTRLLADDIDIAISNTAKYAQSLVDGLTTPVVSDGVPSGSSDTYQASQVITNSQDGRLYQKQDDGTWKALISIVSDTGTLSDSQIAEVSAAKVAGKLTAQQIASVMNTQITGKLSADQIAAVNAASIQGSITSDQIEDLEAAKISGEISSVNIADNSISTPKLQAGAVTAKNVASGAVTTEALAVASLSNLIWNSAPDATLDGWNLGFAIDATGASPDPNIIGFNGITYNCPVSGVTWQNGMAGIAFAKTTSGVMFPDQHFWGLWNPTGDQKAIQVTPFKKYCFSFDASSFGSSVGCQIAWHHSDGTTSYSNLVIDVADFGGVTWWQFTDRYKRIGVIAIAPTGAAWATPVFHMYGNGSDEHPNACFTKFMFGEVPINCTELPTYNAGGVTSISGNVIKTGTLLGDRIVANSITAGQIVSKSLTSNEIASGSLTSDVIGASSILTSNLASGCIDTSKLQSNCVTTDILSAGAVTANNIATNAVTTDKLAANSVTAGTVQSGAIGTDQLAARAVRAQNLAVEELIVDHAQIGDLVVGTNHLQNDSVTVYGQIITNIIGKNGSATFDINSASECAGILSVSMSQYDSAVQVQRFSIHLDDGNNSSLTSYITGQAGSLTIPCNLKVGINTITLSYVVTNSSGSGETITMHCQAVCLARIK